MQTRFDPQEIWDSLTISERLTVMCSDPSAAMCKDKYLTVHCGKSWNKLPDDVRETLISRDWEQALKRF